MTIEKLPSGSYRIRQMEHGRMYSMTVPYKPSKKDAFDLIQSKINHVVDNNMSFQEAAIKYIEVKTDVLSPSSIREYHCIVRNLPQWFIKLDIATIGNYEAQKLINEHSKTHAPKSTHSLWGFVYSVIRLFYPSTIISVTLPQKVRTEHYAPSRDDVMKILEHAQGTPYFIPVYLGTLGLRTSEICALTIDDLVGDAVKINKACVRSDNGYVVKPCPKTDKSNRVVSLPPDLAEAIREQGYIYEGYPRQITKYLHRAQKDLGIPAFGLHMLRHFFAAYSHDLGYSDAQIQKMGGWSTDNIMKSVYRYSMNDEQVAAQVKEDFSFLPRRG